MSRERSKNCCGTARLGRRRGETSMKQDPSILERLFSLRGKSVLVTGAAGGIGRVLAVAMAEAGARLALHDVALEHLAQPCQAVRDVGGEAFPLVADLLDVEACR